MTISEKPTSEKNRHTISLLITGVEIVLFWRGIWEMSQKIFSSEISLISVAMLKENNYSNFFMFEILMRRRARIYPMDTQHIHRLLSILHKLIALDNVLFFLQKELHKLNYLGCLHFQ